jgi:hypothetical protein
VWQTICESGERPFVVKKRRSVDFYNFLKLRRSTFFFIQAWLLLIIYYNYVPNRKTGNSPKTPEQIIPKRKMLKKENSESDHFSQDLVDHALIC